VGHEGFMRTWPGLSVLEVKYRGQKAPEWIYQLAKDIDRERESTPYSHIVLRRQDRGKFCDSEYLLQYMKKLDGEFDVSGPFQYLMRFIGLRPQYPASSNSVRLAGLSKDAFEERHRIDPNNPHDIEPLDYGQPRPPDASITQDVPTHTQPPIPPRATSQAPATPSGGRAQRGATYRLLQESNDEGFARAFADAISSCYGEREICLAFDTGLGGVSGVKAMEIIKVLEGLRTDPRYAAVSIIRYDPLRIGKTGRNGTRILTPLEEKLKDEEEKRPEQRALFFTFARATQDVRDKMRQIERTSRIKETYVDETLISGLLELERARSPHERTLYYPTFEIVTASLAQDRDPHPIEDISAELKKTANVSLREDDNGILIATILPDIAQFDTNARLCAHIRDKKAFLIDA